MTDRLHDVFARYLRQDPSGPANTDPDHPGQIRAPNGRCIGCIADRHNTAAS